MLRETRSVLRGPWGAVSHAPCCLLSPELAWSPGQAQAGLWAMGGHALFSLLTAFSQFYVLFVNLELPDIQAGFRKGRGVRDQIATIRWIIVKI